ncbi:MAG: DNA translocase FtsK 4TM domain-containing protein [Clostridia bacterium]
MSRKKTQKKKGSNDKKGGSRFNNEVIGLLVLLLGVLMTLGFYFQGSIGIFGKILRNIFFGTFGTPSFAIPPLIMIYAIFMIFNKNSKAFKQRMIYVGILLLLLSALFNAAFYKPSSLVNYSKWQYIQYFVSSGIEMQGGGLIGGLISIPLLITLKSLGTIIILTVLAIIDMILLTKFSIAKTAKTFKDTISTKYQALRDEDAAPRMKIDNDDPIEFKPKTNIIEMNLENAEKELSEIDDKFMKTISNNEQIGFLEKEDERRVKSEEQETVSVHNSDNDIEYEFPPITLLNSNLESGKNVKIAKSTAFESAKKLEETLSSFGVEAKVINISRGPTVTRFELQPSKGVKVSRIVNLADDISLNLASSGVRIEAPIPGKAAIGIEVPNSIVTSVPLRDVIESENYEKFTSKLAFAVGKDISGESIIADISKMPHLLIAGATGSGKSVCINSMIISILYKSAPKDVKVLMIDTKVVELGAYNGIPHLLIPVVTDPKKAAGALNWAVIEMVNRYKLFAEKGVRDIKGYNAIMRKSEDCETLPQIVIIIDELADLMMVAPNDVEDAVCRLAQMARAAGMHLVIATQRPSVDVITGIIKANIPSRISFAVSSQIDSRTILDMGGAEKLLGRGDMLFYPVGEPKPVRIQGSYVTEKEVEKVVEFIKRQGETNYNEKIIEEINNEKKIDKRNLNEADELLPRAIEIVVDAGQASASLLQRKFKIGYARAARIVDQMEERKIVGIFEGSKPRQVLITKLQLQEMQMRNDDYTDESAESVESDETDE